MPHPFRKHPLHSTTHSSKPNQPLIRICSHPSTCPCYRPPMVQTSADQLEPDTEYAHHTNTTRYMIPHHWHTRFKSHRITIPTGCGRPFAAGVRPTLTPSTTTTAHWQLATRHQLVAVLHPELDPAPRTRPNSEPPAYKRLTTSRTDTTYRSRAHETSDALRT